MCFYYSFLLSVLFSNITMFLEKETLKAVTVLYRSEIMKLYQEKKKMRKDNYHFSEYYDENELKFSYKIQNGPCTTTNARAILRLAGLMND